MKKTKWMGILSLMLLLTACSETQKVNSITTQIINEQEDKVLEVYGVVKENKATNLLIDFPAKVKEVYVKNGDILKQGQPILVLDLEEYQHTILIKEKEIASLELKLKMIEKKLDSNVIQVQHLEAQIDLKQQLFTNKTDPDLLILINQIEQADQEIKLIEKTYEYEKEIFEIGGLAKVELENIENELIEAKNSKKELELQLEKLQTSKKLEIENLRSQLSTYKTQVTNTNTSEALEAQEAQIQIQIAEIELADMKEKLIKPYIQGNMIISNRADGIVNEISLQEGDSVGNEQATAVCKIIENKELIISVDVPQSFISQIKEGSIADIRLSEQRNEIFKGKVVSIAQYACKVNGENMVQVEIMPEGDVSPFKLGYEVDVTLKLG